MREKIMDHKIFWNIMKETKQKSSGDVKHQVVLIEAYLWNFSLAEIEIFYRIYLAFRILASDEKLEMEIGQLMGFSDDSFDYFKAWLIAQGEDIFHKVVKDPTQLQNFLRGNCQLEELNYVPYNVYEAKLGRDWLDIPGKGDSEPYDITGYELLYLDDDENEQSEEE